MISAAQCVEPRDAAYRHAKHADRAFATLLKESGATAVLTSQNGLAAQEAAREAWATLLVGDPVQAVGRDAHLRVWTLHHAPIDELQRALRREPRSSVPTAAALELRRLLGVVLNDAQRYFEGVVSQLHPMAAAAAASGGDRAARNGAGSATSSATTATTANGSGLGSGPSAPAAVATATATLASNLCVALGDLRRYESALPGQPSDTRRRLVELSRRGYLAAARLACADGRPHNCLGVLSLAIGEEGRAAYHYAISIGSATGAQARRNARSNLTSLLERSARPPSSKPSPKPSSKPSPSSARAAGEDGGGGGGGGFEVIAAALWVVFSRIELDSLPARAAKVASVWGGLPSSAPLRCAVLLVTATHDAARPPSVGSADAGTPSDDSTVLPPLLTDPAASAAVSPAVSPLVPPLVPPMAALTMRALAASLRALSSSQHASSPSLAAAGGRPSPLSLAPASRAAGSASRQHAPAATAHLAAASLISAWLSRRLWLLR